LLDRHYPASLLVRAAPSPQTAQPASHEVPVDRHDDHRSGFPCCCYSPLPACRRHYPGRSDGTHSLVLFRQRRPSLACGGSAPALHLSGPAQRLLTLRPACSPSRLRDPLHQRLRRLRFLCRRSDCFYEKVIKVKADVAALLCLISVLLAFGTSGPPSLRLLVFLPFLFFVAFATFPQKIWR